jgi:hypothetical protein
VQFVHCSKAQGRRVGQGLHYILPVMCFPIEIFPNRHCYFHPYVKSSVYLLHEANNLHVVHFMSYEVKFIYLPTKEKMLSSFLLSVNISDLSELRKLVKFNQVTYFSNFTLTLKKVRTLPLFSIA